MITYDVAGMIEAHKRALCCVFGVAAERVDVRETVTWEGADPHPVVTIDLRLDGGRAPDEWWAFSRDILDAAQKLHDARKDGERIRAELADAHARIDALPWHRRWILRARMALRSRT